MSDTPSEATINAVNAVISGGDVSQRSVYVATPSQAAALGWDNSLVMVFNDGDKSEKSFNYYTTEDIKNELKRYETTIRAGTKMPSDAANKIVEWAEAQVGKTSFYNKSKSSDVVSKNQCASFVKSAYYEAGLGYMSGNAQDLPHPNPIEYNSDGTINYSNIPVGAIIVSKGSPVNGVYYGHVCLYVGNGYTIEAGGEKVAKLPIDQCYGNRGCAPLLGWGFAMEDQNDAYSKLVVEFSGSPTGAYPGEYNKNDENIRYTTGLAGVYNNGIRSFNVYSQGYNSAWGPIPYSGGTFGTSACGATSVAIVSSAKDSSITPETAGRAIYEGIGATFGQKTSKGATDHSSLSYALKKFGIRSEWKYSASKQEIIAHLQTGQPIIFNVSANTRYGDTSTSSSCGHYVTLLGINNNGQIFLGDPKGQGTHNAYFDPSQLIVKSNGVCFVYY